MTSRRQYRHFVYSILGITVVIIAGAFVVVQRIWPIVMPVIINPSRPALKSFAAACGCEQYIVNNTMTWPVGLALIGLSGVLVALTFAMFRAGSMFFRTRRFEHTLQVQIIQRTESSGIAIYSVSDTNPLAVCIGFWKPRIYVSTGLQTLLKPSELWAVLRHELDHAKHRDPIYRFVLHTVRPFFPFFGTMFAQYQALPEIAADEAINDDRTLQQALVKMLTYHNELNAGLAATFFSAAEIRVDRLLGKTSQHPPRRSIIIFPLVIGVSMFVSYQALAQPDSYTELSICLAEQPMCQEIMSQTEPKSAASVASDRTVFQSDSQQSQPFMNIITTEYYYFEYEN